MRADSPLVVVVAGPSGAGKSTLAPQLLRRRLGITDDVDADTIPHPPAPPPAAEIQHPPASGPPGGATP